MLSRPISRSFFPCAKIFGAATLLVCLLPSAAAQVIGVRDQNAVAALKAAVLALGGSVPTDMVASGTIHITAGGSSESGSMRVLSRGIDQALESFRTPEREYTLIYSRGFASEVKDGTAMPAALEMAVTSQSPLLPLPLLRRLLDDPAVSVAYVGLETLNGMQVFHVRTQVKMSNPKLRFLEADSTKDIWIDAANGLPRKFSYAQRAAGGSAPSLTVEISYNDFRPIQGMLVPFSINKSINGTTWATIHFEAVLSNTGLTDADFPAE